MSQQERRESPYEVLGIEPQFEVDTDEIQRAYLAKASMNHPDRAADPVKAAAEMANLNQARSVLLDPEQRAHALLRDISKSEAIADKSLPEGFLAKIFAVRQEMEEELNQGGEEAREAFHAWANEHRQLAMATVSSLFRALPKPPSESDIRAIMTELNAWRYIERMIEQLDPDYSTPKDGSDAAD